MDAERSTDSPGWIATTVFALGWAALALWSWMTDGSLIFGIGGLAMAVAYGALAMRKWRRQQRSAVSDATGSDVVTGARRTDPPSSS